MKKGLVIYENLLTDDQWISIIMAGMQTYSSDSSNLLCREYLSGKQAALEQKLKQQVEIMMDDPVFRRKYIAHKDRLGRAYINKDRIK